MKEKKINTGLFFGSFNPLHIGHITVAEYFVKNNYVEEVWFVISPQSPFKQHFNINNNPNNTEYFISEEKRLEILEKGIEDYPEFKICDIELSMPKPSYTINTLNKLSENYPDRNFIFIMGSDQLKDFKLWKNWQDILDNYKIYVYPRNKEDFQYLLPGMILFEDAPMINISSTQIRQDLSQL